MARNRIWSTLAMAFAALTACVGTAAYGQATRTWVSGVGDDVNPCSRTAPCKTFAGAISKTASGGEINCLDPGGYGTLTITKSITVDCTGTFGSSLNSGGINGFIINDSASGTPGTAEVALRGLSIDGAGTTQGLNGIRFISGNSLTVENVLINNQGSGNGISFAPVTSARLYAVNLTVVYSGSGTTGAGILIKPTGTGAANVHLEDVRLVGNAGSGLEVDTTGLTGSSSNIVVVRGAFSGSRNGVSVTGPAGTPGASVNITDSSISGNIVNGLLATGPLAQIRIANSLISGNTNGILSSGATIVSFGQNSLMGNGSNGSFSGTIPQN
ncbi:hypothetical protein [Sphingomonas sp. SUN039]|uniref:hypothetical protein n=1 Tax=Sphingomonas sp. SUN039 TaxID=2937787 RepID=UPI002164D632|nr:hypothetical protein [Sphingomonas sp. SUN039]UVO52827.1 hypothetical protein M0209_01335 [Sphingomonas sp. SUN039]